MADDFVAVVLAGRVTGLLVFAWSVGCIVG